MFVAWLGGRRAAPCMDWVEEISVAELRRKFVEWGSRRLRYEGGRRRTRRCRSSFANWADTSSRMPEGR